MTCRKEMIRCLAIVTMVNFLRPSAPTIIVETAMQIEQAKRGSS